MGKVEVRPHRIDCEMFRPGKKVRGTVLYAGRISPEKQVDLILNAVRQVSGVQLMIVGTGTYRLDGRTVTAKPLPRKDLAILMSATDILCLPSKYEQASKILLEAMASGCLVIATAEASRGVIVDGRTGYLCLPRADSLAAAIRVALADPLAETVRQAAREYVVKWHGV